MTTAEMDLATKIPNGMTLCVLAHNILSELERTGVARWDNDHTLESHKCLIQLRIISSQENYEILPIYGRKIEVGNGPLMIIDKNYCFSSNRLER